MIRRLEWIGVGAGVDVEQWRMQLGHEIDRRFGTRSVTGTELPWNPAWCDPETGQARADPVLDALIDRSGERDWVLGLTNADLSAPSRPFVFGEATVGGCCALISLARLNDGSARLVTRVLTTIVHELAHVAGVDHCENSSCVMWASSTAEDTDRKGDVFCGSCGTVFAQILAQVDRS